MANRLANLFLQYHRVLCSFTILVQWGQALSSIRTTPSLITPANGRIIGSTTKSRSLPEVIEAFIKTIKSVRPLKHIPPQIQTDLSTKEVVETIKSWLYNCALPLQTNIFVHRIYRYIVEISTRLGKSNGSSLPAYLVHAILS